MAGINNKYDYRDGILNALKAEHTPHDVRNEDEYRKKVLDGFGVEYTDDDINQKNLFREKVVSGLASGGGGGGDLSIAEVIFSVTGNASATLYDFVVIADLPSGNRTLTHFDELVINSSSASIYTIPMVDGKIDMGISSEDTITTSGNVEYLPDDEYIIITGDCTITIS